MSQGTGRHFAGVVCHALWALGCLIGLPLWGQSVRVDFQAVPREVVVSRLHRIHAKNAEREADLKEMFDEVGCTGERLEEQVVRQKDPPNVMCTLPGLSNSLIIVGAHFDHAELGSGAVDDWSGASLLPSLFQALKDAPRKHTFTFVGFTDEEKGLLGSEFFVKHFAKDRLAAVCAMVNLECLGVGPTAVWAKVADKRLLTALVNTTQSMHINLRAFNPGNGANDDTQAFRDKRLQVITIHSMTAETWPILHSPRDNLAAVHPDELYESYRLVSGYLAFIDQLLE